MEKKLKVYRTEEESRLKKAMNTLGKYVPRPGLAGTVGAVAGAGVGSMVGFAGNAAYYLVTQAGSYVTSGNGLDLLMKTYEHAARGGGEWGLIGSVAGLILFSKCRDYVLSLFGLKE